MLETAEFPENDPQNFRNPQLAVIGSAAIQGCLGSGGCPDTNPTTKDLTVTPATPCLDVTATDTGSCGDIDHHIEIKNTCADTLVIDGETIPPGSTSSFTVATSDSNLCTEVSPGSRDYSCSLAGDLGTSSVTIAWDVLW